MRTGTFVVLDQRKDWPHPVLPGYFTRAVRQHAGWQSVRFDGKRYQLFGGIRGDEFIDLSNPLGKKAK